MAVNFEIRGRVAVIEIDRPDALNALDLVSLQQLSYMTGQTLYVCGGRSLSSPSV
jgi:3-oxoacyl-[acyl-carrier protein] reductase